MHVPRIYVDADLAVNATVAIEGASTTTFGTSCDSKPLTR